MFYLHGRLSLARPILVGAAIFAGSATITAAVAITTGALIDGAFPGIQTGNMIKCLVVNNEEIVIYCRVYGIINDILIDKIIRNCSAFYIGRGDHRMVHFEQKIFEITNKISSYLILKKHNKYTQLWLINNCKKLKNN